jgi:hypothetical protein
MAATPEGGGGGARIEVRRAGRQVVTDTHGRLIRLTRITSLRQFAHCEGEIWLRLSGVELRYQEPKGITMPKLATIFAALVVFSFFVTGFVSLGLAAPLTHGLQNRMESPVLLIKKRCKTVKVCDYYAPASSCSHPPCCKRWHLERVCD